MPKKSYMPLILWSVGLIVITVATCFLPFSTVFLVAVINNEISLALAGVMYLVYRNERVHWITGVTYRQSVAAGSERRRLYRRRHFDTFLYARLVTFAMTVTLLTLKRGVWPHLISCWIIILIAGFSTIRFKL